VCLAEKANVKHNTTDLISWMTPGRASVYAEHKLSRMIMIQRTLNHTNFNKLDSTDAKLYVDRCCVSSASAMANNFGACLKTKSNENEPLLFDEL
jgi:hypothetical protein